MSLNVEMPFGPSPLTKAVIEILQTIDALTTVKVGPALYEDPVPDWSCTDEGEYLSLRVPISNGYRMFIIEHYSGRKTTGDSSKQLARKILRYIQTAPLPPEQAEHDHARRKSIQHQVRQEPVTPVKNTVPLRVVPPTNISFVIIRPRKTVAQTERPVSADNPIELLAKIKELAGTQRFVIGLITKLHTIIGGEREHIVLAVDQLIADGKIECNDHHIVLEIYQRFTIK